MNSPEYDFDRFIAKIKDLDLAEILDRIHEEIRQTERLIGPHVRGAPERRKSGAPEYVNLLKGTYYALSNNQRPSSVQPWDLRRMWPIWESLVRRGQLAPEALKLFETAD
jgi:hypothetical protein